MQFSFLDLNPTISFEEETGHFTFSFTLPVTLDHIVFTNEFVTPGNQGQIGEIIGYSAQNNVVPLDNVTLLDDAQGNISVRQVGNRWFYDAPNGLSFEAEGTKYAKADYRPRFSITKGSVTLENEIVLKPAYSVINPQGAPAGTTPRTYTTQQEFHWLLSSQAQDYQLLEPAVSGFFEPPAGTIARPETTFSHSTISGINFPNTCWKFPRGIAIKEGDDLIIEGLLLGNGMPDTPREVEAFLVGFTGSKRLENVLFRKNTIFGTNDELLSLTNGGASVFGSRHIRFTENIFCYPFYAANHPEGDNHDLGPLITNGPADIMFDHNIVWGPRGRLPQIAQGVLGVDIFNNLVAGWMPNYGGMIINGEYLPLTANIQGNLFHIGDAVAGEKDGAIMIRKLDGNTSSLYIPPSNHFVKLQSDDYSTDVVSYGNGITEQTSINGPIVKDTPGFIRPGMSLHSTATEQERRDLVTYLKINCGKPGNYLTTHVINQVSIGEYDFACTPQHFETLFGMNWESLYS